MNQRHSPSETFLFHSLRSLLISGLLFLGLFGPLQFSLSAAISLTHEFKPTDGAKPQYCGLIKVGSRLYGMTQWGGSYNKGTVFCMNLDGSGYSILHHFAGGTDDGARPKGALVDGGGVLFGVTAAGGSIDFGTIFSINLDGSGFAVLHRFGDEGPSGSLIAIGDALFGLTAGGGEYGLGTVYKLGKDGNGFTILHDFSGGSVDGYHPVGSLASDGNSLYGATEFGGTYELGTIFKIGVDGDGYSILHLFQNGEINGEHPENSLTLADGCLYGTTDAGGSGHLGTIFKVGVDGNGFSVLHSFSAGIQSSTPLLASNDVLFGALSSGGAYSGGAIFRIDSDGTDFRLLRSFEYTSEEGYFPDSPLIESAGILFGMTSAGGEYGNGRVYRINPDGGEFASLHDFVGWASNGGSPRGALIEFGGALFGTFGGGADGDGCIFKIDPDGSDFSILHNFSYVSSDGIHPSGSLTEVGGRLYGMLERGFNSNGAIFGIDPDGKDYSLIHSFALGPAEEGQPCGSLIEVGGVLYGMTPTGGPGESGVIFQINPDGSGYHLLHGFSGGAGDGSGPRGALVEWNGKLFGTTPGGGSSDKGTVFGINADGSGFAVLHSFQGGDDGERPGTTLLALDGTLYGITDHGGSGGLGKGAVFTLNPDGSEYSLLHSFSGEIDGDFPTGGLIESNGMLFGVTSAGGDKHYGVLFKINTDGSGFIPLHSFAGGESDGRIPCGSLLKLGGVLFGMTDMGGDAESGVVYSYDLSQLPKAIEGRVTAGGIPLQRVVMNGLPGNPMTDNKGHFSAAVGSGWSGIVTPTLADFNFTPINRTYANVTTDLTGQDYVATATAGFLVTFAAGPGGSIVGPGAQIVNLGGSTSNAVVANADSGYYFVNWTGTGGFASTANPLIVTNVTSDMTIAANFAPEPSPAIGLDHSRMQFSKVGGVATSAQTLCVANTGGGTLNWQAAGNEPWIVLDQTSGSGNARIQVSVNTSGLGGGTYRGTIAVTDAAATNSPQLVAVTLVVKSAGAKPFGAFETPAAGVTGVAGNVAVTGWALDDVEVTAVRIYRAPLAGEGTAPVYIGEANLVEGARPDVEALYGDSPFNYRAGWGYMLLTNFLPSGGNGVFTLHAVATDREGHSVTLGSKTITCDNANATLPFGTIDTPAQGGTASGASYVNFGWALTPPPGSIPVDGSTLWVWVDGAPLGHPVYNQFRSDIATLFPGYANSDGAVGYYYLDPSTLAEGVHTIAWSVRDDLGREDGIGSRYFSVSHDESSYKLGTPRKEEDSSLVKPSPKGAGEHASGGGANGVGAYGCACA